MVDMKVQDKPRLYHKSKLGVYTDSEVKLARSRAKLHFLFFIREYKPHHVMGVYISRVALFT